MSTILSDMKVRSDLTSRIQSPPVVSEDNQPAPSTSSASVHAKKVQSSIGACDACRLRKVRCLANESSMSSKCQRCTRANRECVYTTHSKTRRRKRTDTRVKELEEKVRGLSMLLESKTANSNQSSAEMDALESTEFDLEETRDPNEYPSRGGYGGATEDGFSPLGLPTPPHSLKGAEAVIHAFGQGRDLSHSQNKDLSDPSPIFPDVIDRGILSMEKATELHSKYVNDLQPMYPAVALPLDCTAAKLRESRPILFLAVLAASAGASSPALNLRLNKEIQQVYATKVSIQGRKSLELVQAMLISILWTYPPDKFEDLKYHQQITQAATMALDLGLVQKHRPCSSRSRSKEFYDSQYSSPSSQSDGSPAPTISSDTRLPDSSALESRRTLLACYVFCASASVSLRLPNMLRFSSWFAEALDVLEKLPNSAPADKRFIAWVKLQRVVEECGSALAMDDPYGANVSLADRHVQAMIGGCEKQLDAWRADNKEIMNSFLEITYHANNIYLHEIALHPDHDVDDFRPPFFIAVKLPSTESQTALTPPYINAIIQCISSADALITAFLDMDLDEIIQCPTLIFVRVVYASVVLIKLSISASMPSSELGRIIASESNKIDIYLEQLLVHLRTAATYENGSKHVVSWRFLGILTKLKLWYQRQKQQSSTDFSSADELEQEEENNHPFSIQPDILRTASHGLPYDPAINTIPWPRPPLQQNEQHTSQYRFPSTGKPDFYTDYAEGHTVPAVNHSAPQSMRSPSWPTIFQTSARYSEPAPMPFTLPMETDPNLFTHLVNAELDQNNHENWMPENFNALDFSNIPEFNWPAWPQQ